MTRRTCRTILLATSFAGEKKVYKQTFVILDEGVSRVFQTSEDVNVVLRSAIRGMRTEAPKSSSQKRRAS